MSATLDTIFFAFTDSVGHDERIAPDSSMLAHTPTAIQDLRMESTSYICMIDQWQYLIVGTAYIVAVLTNLVHESSSTVSKVISYCFSKVHVEQSFVLYWRRQIVFVQLLRHLDVLKRLPVKFVSDRTRLLLIRQVLHIYLDSSSCLQTASFMSAGKSFYVTWGTSHPPHHSSVPLHNMAIYPSNLPVLVSVADELISMDPKDIGQHMGKLTGSLLIRMQYLEAR